LSYAAVGRQAVLPLQDATRGHEALRDGLGGAPGEEQHHITRIVVFGAAHRDLAGTHARYGTRHGSFEVERVQRLSPDDQAVALSPRNVKPAVAE
jgi:hypothetical protein